MKSLWIKIIQLLQFKFLQPFYLIWLKVILWLMNYWVWWSTFGNWEIKTLKLVNNYLKSIDNPIIFDVWANIWQYLKDINKFITTPSTVYCFEPQLEVFNKLKEVCFESHHHKIYPINVWFGDIKGFISIYSELWWRHDKEQSCSSMLPTNITNFLSKQISEERIYIDTIDDFYKENMIGHIHFLKIDIEGYEFKCLQWAKTLIEQDKIDIIQLEHNRCAIASRTFLKDYWDIFSTKYVICRPLSNDRWLYLMKNYDIYLESFTYTNYVIIKKDIYKQFFT